ncbi:hypothetical protein CMV_006278 [Castanea mollissima]|uniref:Phosphoribosyl-AMP cyclohydrolase domain-containing protein n=1 Tax=Castanea mollissima TaxID=60419 RepID=A0A8J4RR58_9ROSI|nr:hypothetical protein CMV_006278 [Castanea mollissima]
MGLYPNNLGSIGAGIILAQDGPMLANNLKKQLCKSPLSDLPRSSWLPPSALPLSKGFGRGASDSISELSLIELLRHRHRYRHTNNQTSVCFICANASKLIHPLKPFFYKDGGFLLFMSSISESVLWIPSLQPEKDLCLESKVQTLLDNVKWDDKGLAVAIAQNVDTGAILMQGFANRDAVVKAISSRKATFYSRSRSMLWTKGETSNNFINIHDIFFDCDRDSIIYLGKPDGPTCHTGSETCYYTSVFDLKERQQVEGNELALTTLYSLESTILQRKSEVEAEQNGKPSWTKRLLLDNHLLCSKIREEADELCRTLEENEDKSRTTSEMADVLYHAMVLLALRDVKMEDVMQVLRQRFSKSGIEEKKSRVLQG